MDGQPASSRLSLPALPLLRRKDSSAHCIPRRKLLALVICILHSPRRIEERHGASPTRDPLASLARVNGYGATVGNQVNKPVLEEH